MNKTLIKRLPFLLVVAVLLSGCGVEQMLPKKEPQTNEFRIVDRNQQVFLKNDTSRLLFDFDKVGIDFLTGDNQEYRSVPEGEISGLNRVLAMSMLSINVINEEGKLEQYYSYSECVTSGNYEVYLGNEKIRILYMFPSVSVKVPVEFSLSSEKTVTVSVPVQEIVDEGNKLVDISLLPYFGAAGSTDQGYILVPDGSGAAVKFNNGKEAYGSSKYSVYGTDAMQSYDYATVNENTVNLPMYAFMFEGENPKAFLAYIDEGDALASLNVCVSDANCPYNTAYFSFNYRPYVLTTILDRTNKSMKYHIASQNIVACEKFEVNYTHFEDSEASLSSIANYVANRVFGGREKKAESQQSVFLDVYASVYKRVYTLGVPHQANVALTTLNDCGDIAEDFSNSVILLRGLDKYGAVGGSVDSKFTISSKVGNSKEYNALTTKADVYNYCEFTQFDRNSIGATKLLNAARSVTGQNVSVYSYNPATLLADNQSFSLLDPMKLEKKLDTYLTSAKSKSVTGIAPITLGNAPYTSHPNSDRQETMRIFEENLQKISEGGMKQLLFNPAGYALKYAQKVMNLPTQSSKQSLIDYDIPFIQMVARDYVDYSGEAVNISGNRSDSVLNAAKTGSNLCFAITNVNYTEIKDTGLDYLYGTDYTLSRERFVALYDEYTERMSTTLGSTIVGYAEVDFGVYMTEFSNDSAVYVNYNNYEYTLENGTVLPAKDYLVLSGKGEMQ